MEADFLRRPHQCTARGRVPWPALYFTAILKLDGQPFVYGAEDKRRSRWIFLRLGHRPTRLAQAKVPKVLRKRSAAAPDAGHARHDHGAARPVFLHIGCIAHPNGIRAGIVARINPIGLDLSAGINANPPRRTGGRMQSQVLGRQRLRNLRALLRCLRFSTHCEQRKRARKEAPQYCPFPDTHGDARPQSAINRAALRSPIAAATSTGKGRARASGSRPAAPSSFQEFQPKVGFHPSAEVL
jgi:hypothetical protein